MSKPNKANKNNYVQAGRLTSDEMAREQKKMGPLRRAAKAAGAAAASTARRKTRAE